MSAAVTAFWPAIRGSRTNTKIGIANTRKSSAVSRKRSTTGMSSRKISSPTNTVPQ